MTDYVRWRSRPKRVVKLFPVNRRKVEGIVERHLRQGIREIGETESKEILEAYGFVTPKGSIATTSEQAANIAQQLGFPVVLKIWSPDILHKSDVGGVKVGLNSEQKVKDAFDLMMYRIPKKQPEANILGFGMGGIMVEVLKDVSFYLAPLTAEEAERMLINTKTYQMLKKC